MNWNSILRFRLIGVILALALSVAIPVGYVAAAEMNVDLMIGKKVADPIRTDAGYVAGTIIGDIGKEVRIYRGIPYAAPPVGDLRWKPPQVVTPWTGIRECTKFSLWAPQAFPGSILFGGITEKDMGEDCLYVNVQTPVKRTTDRLPVMVWFHGGGLTTSSGNFLSYNLPSLPQHGVVLVTVSHRLGAIGYMAHPALTAESANHASGNYGQLDQVAALKWVQRNIEAFGGDPDCVTIFGQSGGGGKVSWLLASPLAKGLFHRAIIEAGSQYMGKTKSLADAEKLGKNLAAKLGVSNADAAVELAAMRAKTWQNIITNSLATDSGYSTLYTADGWSLPEALEKIFLTGKQSDVPLMIGAGRAEKAEHQNIQLWADAFLPPTSDLYVYVFSHVPTNWRNFGLEAYHGLEVAYQFGTIDKIYNHYGILFAAPAGLPKDPGIDWMDEYIADATMSIWAQFAETGKPTVLGIVRWPTFEPQFGKDKYLDIVYPLKAKSGYMDLFR